MVYETGRIIEDTQLQARYPEVLKFGQVTEATKGYLEFDGAAVKKIQFNARHGNSTKTYTLYRQLEIRPKHKHARFSDLGDSGSFVFVEDVTGELACIGMIVGILDNHSFVTPIKAITEELGVKDFYNFKLNKIDVVSRKLDQLVKKVNKLDTLSQKIDELDRKVNKIDNLDKKVDVLLNLDKTTSVDNPQLQ